MNSRILTITRTAIFIALLIAVQAATAPLGNTLVTGSFVNFILIICVMTCGLVSGLGVAAISPVFAKLLGIGPLWELIPIIILGNAVLVILWYFITKQFSNHPLIGNIVSAIFAAGAKFAVLYFGVVRIVLPLLGLPEQQMAVISAAFSVSQFITALIGGGLAILVLPVLKKAISKLGH